MALRKFRMMPKREDSKKKREKEEGKSIYPTFSVYIGDHSHGTGKVKHDFGWPVSKNPGRYISAPMVQPSVYGPGEHENFRYSR